MATDSKERLLEGALEALKTKGFGGASARSIAALAGVNPGLIFYYFDTLDELLLAALAHSSEDRLRRYRGELGQLATAPELLAFLRRIYREDLDSGHIRVVCEMVAGSVARPEMGERVMGLMQPWIAIAEEAAGRVLGDSPVAALASPRDLAFAAVTFYLGANLVVQLGTDAEAVDRLLEIAEGASHLLALLDEPGSTERSPTTAAPQSRGSTRTCSNTNR